MPMHTLARLRLRHNRDFAFSCHTMALSSPGYIPCDYGQQPSNWPGFGTGAFGACGRPRRAPLTRSPHVGCPSIWRVTTRTRYGVPLLPRWAQGVARVDLVSGDVSHLSPNTAECGSSSERIAILEVPGGYRLLWLAVARSRERFG